MCRAASNIFYPCIFVLLGCLISSGRASIKFYDGINFQGWFYESHATASSGCINLPIGNDQTSSVNTGGGCVILYEHGNCRGRSLDVDHSLPFPSNLAMHNFNDITSSFRICAGTQKPALLLYDHRNHRNLLVEYKEICGCTNLPSFANNRVSSVNTPGYCIRLYEHANCGGRMLELAPGKGDDHRHLANHNFNDITSSVNICGGMESCHKLNANVVKFRFLTSLRDLLQTGNFDKVELATSSYFINNASSPITRTYSGTKTIREKYTFETIESLSRMHSVRVEKSVSVEGGAGIPFVANGQVKSEFKFAYEFQTQTGSQSRREHTTETSKAFTVQETYTVPHCTEYEVSSFLLFGKNIPMKFEMDVHVTGESQGRRMTAGELSGKLTSGMEYIRDMEGFMILARTRGEINASFGVRSIIEAHGRRINGCNIYRAINNSTI